MSGAVMVQLSERCARGPSTRACRASLRMTPSIGVSGKVIGGVGEENYCNQSKDNDRGPSTTPLRGFAQDDTITGLEAGEELPVQLLLPKRCESR